MNRPDSLRPSRPPAPRRAGKRPHTLPSALAAALALGSFAACTSGDAQVENPVVVGMTDKLTPFYQDQNLTLYEVQIPVQLPIRPPTPQDQTGQGPAPKPYPRAPFLLASDTRVEVRFTLTNLDDASHTVELLLDPWNEFVRYRPGIAIVSDEQSTPNFSGYDKFFIVPGKSRVTGTITPDDTLELAIDLATVQNILATPPADANAAKDATAHINRAFNLQNRSNDGDPILAPFIPPVIAGLTGFDLGLRTEAQANLAVEVTVDVQDQTNNRVLPPDTPKDKLLPMPTTILSPPGAKM